MDKRKGLGICGYIFILRVGVLRRLGRVVGEIGRKLDVKVL